MSIDMYRNNVTRLKKQKDDLEKKAGQEEQVILKLRGEIVSLTTALSRSTSLSMLKMKQRQIETKGSELGRVKKRYEDIQANLTRVIKELSNNTRNLERAEEQEQKKRDAEAKRRRDAELAHARTMTAELTRQNSVSNPLGSVSADGDSIIVPTAQGEPLVLPMIHGRVVTPPRSDSSVRTKGGRPSNPDDDWAWEQVWIHRRPKKEVRLEWEQRIGERAEVLADIERSWRLAVRSNRQRRKPD